MEKMDARRLLEDVKASAKNVEILQKELDDMDYMIGVSGINYDADRVSSTPKQDGLEMMAIRHLEEVAEIKKELQETVAHLIKVKHVAIEYICQLESEEQKEVLILRYIEGKKWWEILEAKGNDSLSGQMRLRDRAIEELQKIIDKQ